MPLQRKSEETVEACLDDNWYGRSIKSVFATVRSSTNGISPEDAAHRLASNGLNQLVQTRRSSVIHIFLAQFSSLIIWLLIVAGAVSAAMGEITNAVAILVVVILNAFMGFYQELSAEKSVAALLKMTAPKAKVRRHGNIASVPASHVVVGDILLLEAGDLVAADARLIDAAFLQLMEATLTGESEATTKSATTLAAGYVGLGDQRNMVFMGTSVAAGAGEAVVVATAMQTQLGRIAGMINQAEGGGGTPLQQKLDAVGRVLVWAALAIVIVLFAIGLLRGTGLIELSLTAISLAVAAVPEGLPAVVTVALSVGVMQMARRRVLVRKLATVETLGSTTVICTDKTGTLTVGEMTVRALYVAGRHYEVTGAGYEPEGEVLYKGQIAEGLHLAPLLTLATIQLGCNNAYLVESEGRWSTIGDPTEGALLAAGVKAGADRNQTENDFPSHLDLPFDSDRKRSSVIRTMPDGKLRAFVNGAPGPLLARCTHIYTSKGCIPLTDEDRHIVGAEISLMAKGALRVLGSAFRDLPPLSPADMIAENVERDMIFVGLSGMYDPPREAARQALVDCKSAGLRVIMITGDHPETASAIAEELGLVSKAAVKTGADMARMTDEDLLLTVPQTAVYARVTAEHKLRIVRALQSHGDVVAMTGDGVNDAPAIKGADIGIAMGKSGTQVTKEAADLIITDDNFATIIDAVKQGRGIYDNIRKTLQYLLAGSTAELLLMAGCVFAGLPAPLLPIHLLWINLVTDGLPALCLATDEIDETVMSRPPRRKNENIMDTQFMITMVLTGVLTVSVSFSVFLYMLSVSDAETARSYAFTTMVFSEILRAFGARSEMKPIWQISLLTNRSLMIVVAATVSIQVWSQHSPLLGSFLKTSAISYQDFFLLFAVSAIPMAVLELVKIIRRARQGRR